LHGVNRTIACWRRRDARYGTPDRASPAYWHGILLWRRRVEDEIRASGLDYTIIRVGLLLNRPGGQHALAVTQDALPLWPRHRIARAHVAEAFLEALPHARASRAKLEVVWGKGAHREDWSVLLGGLKPMREGRLWKYFLFLTRGDPRGTWGGMMTWITLVLRGSRSLQPTRSLR
jgi:hypothetical protein